MVSIAEHLSFPDTISDVSVRLANVRPAPPSPGKSKKLSVTSMHLPLHDTELALTIDVDSACEEVDKFI